MSPSHNMHHINMFKKEKSPNISMLMACVAFKEKCDVAQCMLCEG